MSYRCSEGPVTTEDQNTEDLTLYSLFCISFRGSFLPCNLTMDNCQRTPRDYYYTFSYSFITI